MSSAKTSLSWTPTYCYLLKNCSVEQQKCILVRCIYQGFEAQRQLTGLRFTHSQGLITDTKMAEANPREGYFSMGLNTLKVPVELFAENRRRICEQLGSEFK